MTDDSVAATRKWRQVDDYALQALVRAQILAALQRLPAGQRLPVLRQVLLDGDDVEEVDR